MERLFQIDQLRVICVSLFSMMAAYVTPTKGFVLALFMFFAFNIWCGMRADGVSIIRCRNFSFSKFKNALWEFLIYLVIIWIIAVTMSAMGDAAEALVVVKAMTYVFSYVYVQNAFKNLIYAYPKNIAFRVIYHMIRFEFKRAMPSHVKSVIERIEKEVEKNEREGA